jgi:hypothetical protein
LPTGVTSDSQTDKWFDCVKVSSFEKGDSIGSLPEGAAVTVSTGAGVDLNGCAQTVAGLAGGGLVTNGTLTVNGTIAPGGAETIGTLTLAAASTLSGTLLIDLAADGTGDRLAVQGSLDLSGLTLEIEDPSLFRNDKTYVIVSSRRAG